MGQDARNAILIRLKTALLAKGANNAANRLEIVRDLLRTQPDTRLLSLVMRHCREYVLNPAWILEGRGEETSPPAAPVAWAPVFAMAVTHPRTGRWQLHEIERIALAPFMLRPSCFVIRMDSPSLEPRIHQGAYLIVDTAEDARTAGKDSVCCADGAPTAPFAMDIQGKGLVVRMLPYDQGNPVQKTPRELTDTLGGESSAARIVGRVVWVAQNL